MIYDSSNSAMKCSVYDVDTMQRINQVLSLDDETGEVVVAVEPLEVTASDELATKTLQFRSIYPIRGAGYLPVLFHCYGRKGPFAMLSHGEAIIPAGIEGWGLGRQEGDGYAIGGGSSN